MGQSSKRAVRLATACVALAASASGGGVLALDAPYHPAGLRDEPAGSG